MPPKTRTPKAGNPRDAIVAPDLAPSPGNGVPYVEHARGRGRAAARDTGTVQTGVRIPRALHEQLLEVSERTGISRGRLVADALAEHLQRYQ